ncbi:PREDICTED: Fanconi anemia-associated protein of 24 kDa isoform X1 [Dipodomys ordii]|uniref:Fanconi anemia core complex-associated protein 24 n=2 Tax=Dipodomys ordii TaxID=10020 RepID=A0A1S3G0E4_DIPOR|nr:PREDICTED: Fanconi anemia-associated protein of 24 kDa isoform X1 [Dipodomys ordii]
MRLRPPMESDPSDDTGPVHVPLGYVVAHEKWRGSQLAQEMQGKIKLLFEDGLNLADFYLSSRSCIIYITEAELVAGNSYRKRLVRVRNCGHLQGIVVVEKTQINEQYFPAIQKFVVLDLGMVLLPVGNQMEAACLIVQFVEEQSQVTRKNPFLRKTTRVGLSETSLVRTVQQIPGVGKVKALLLLQKFPSIQQLSNASVQELEQVVGPAVAQQIYTFFTQSR